MSSPHSPIYQGTAKVTLFAATLPTVDPATVPHRVHGLSAVEQMDQAKDQATKSGEKLGYERGHASGFLDGYEQGKAIGVMEAKAGCSEAMAAELVGFVAELNVLTGRLQREIEHWFAESEEKLTDLALVAVRKLLVAELAISRESALTIVIDALSDVTHSKHARIRVNPFDSLILKDHRQELMDAAGSLRDIEFVGDASINGGCIIETDGGMVDATIDTKFVLLEEELRRAA